MSHLRVVSFEGLLARLEQILTRDSLLYRQFERALKAKDDEAVDAAMEALKHHPEATREAVEDAILRWLFDPQDNSGLAALDCASNQLN